MKINRGVKAAVALSIKSIKESKLSNEEKTELLALTRNSIGKNIATYKLKSGKFRPTVELSEKLINNSFKIIYSL